MSLRRATGQAAFAGDVLLPGTLHLALRRSPLAHARVVRADASVAAALPGVALVLCAGDAGSPLSPVLRYVGDRLAVAAAEEPELARRAVDLAEIELEPLPAVLDPEAAAGGEESVVARASAATGDVDAALAGAEHVIEGEWSLPFTPAVSLEPPLAVTWLDEDRRLVVRTSAESPFRVRGILADRLSLPAARIRVVRPLVPGGSFGRAELVVEDLCALVTLRTGRPARLALSAEEELTTTPGRPAQRVAVRMGLVERATHRARREAARGPRGRRRGRPRAPPLLRAPRAGALPGPPRPLRGHGGAHEPAAGERPAGRRRRGGVRRRVRGGRGGRAARRGRRVLSPPAPARPGGPGRRGPRGARRAPGRGRRPRDRRAPAVRGARRRPAATLATLRRRGPAAPRQRDRHRAPGRGTGGRRRHRRPAAAARRRVVHPGRRTLRGGRDRRGGVRGSGRGHPRGAAPPDRLCGGRHRLRALRVGRRGSRHLLRRPRGRARGPPGPRADSRGGGGPAGGAPGRGAPWTTGRCATRRGGR